MCCYYAPQAILVETGDSEIKSNQLEASSWLSHFFGKRLCVYFQQDPTQYTMYSLTCEGKHVGGTLDKTPASFHLLFTYSRQMTKQFCAERFPCWPTTHDQVLYEKPLSEPRNLLLLNKFNIFYHEHPLKILQTVESSVSDHKHDSVSKVELLTFDIPESNVPIIGCKLHLLNSLERTHEVLTKNLIL